MKSIEIYILFILLILLLIMKQKYEYINLKKIENINYSPKKIKVLMLCTPNYLEKSKESINSYIKYCNHYNYDFKIYKEKLIQDLHINFSKMEMIRRELLIEDDYEYLLLTDADIIVKKYLPLEILIEYLDIQNIAAPKDILFGKIYQNHSLEIIRGSIINAGFILVKKNRESYEIFNNWINDSYNDCKLLSDLHPRNQNVFDFCTVKKLKNDQLKYIPWQIGGVPQSIYFNHYFASFSLKQVIQGFSNNIKRSVILKLKNYS